MSVPERKTGRRPEDFLELVERGRRGRLKLYDRLRPTSAWEANRASAAAHGLPTARTWRNPST